MPGSTLSSQSLPSLYNSAFRISFNRSQVDTVNNYINVTHNFTTGDYLWIYMRQGSGTIPTYINRVFAIVNSSSQIRIASSKSNALANIPIDLSSITPSAFLEPGELSNTLTLQVINLTRLAPSYAQASSKSTISFAPSDSVQIDIESSSIGEGRSTFGLMTTNETYLAVCGLFNGSGYGSVNDGYGSLGVYIGDTVLGASSPLRYDLNSPRAIRFVLQGNRVKIYYKASGAYVLGFTSNLLSNLLPPLVFFTNFGLNGLSVNNCTITYL
jgi:hypothetical protein